MVTLIREHGSMFVCSGGCHLHRGGGQKWYFVMRRQIWRKLFSLFGPEGPVSLVEVH